MAIISIPNTFSAGAVIIASQHNLNFSTIYSDYNGNIDNTNIVASAGIVYSKLSLTGSIVNADINSSAAIVASKLDLTSPGAIGSTAPNSGKFTSIIVSGTSNFGTTRQGDILYDNGTSIVRLAAGTSGKYLQTLGSNANPAWSTVASPSNALFQLTASVTETGAGLGEIVGTDLIPTTATGNYRFLSHRDAGNSTFVQVWGTKFIKVAGISTVTVYGQLWGNLAGGQTNKLKVDIGGQNSSVTGSSNQQTPEWVTLTIDVTSLTNGTTYDVAVSVAHSANSTGNAFLGNLIAFGS